jgi:hypothetical protein
MKIFATSRLTAAKFEGIVVPERFNGLPVDLYVVASLFTEQSIENPKLFSQAIKAVPSVGKKYRLQVGGLLYRGQPEDDDPDHTVSMLPGLKARSWSTDKAHASAFGTVHRAQVPDSKVVLNLNVLKELLRTKYPEFYRDRHIEDSYEDEVFVAPDVVGVPIKQAKK